MITLQILNKIIQTGSPEMIINNSLDETYFPFYEKEFNYINNHLQKYGNIPNKESFIAKFKEFQLFDVTESDKYLIDCLQEEYLYNVACPIAVEFAKLLKIDANDAKDYLLEQLPKLTIQAGNSFGVDIIKNAKIRYQEYTEKGKEGTKAFVTTGFPEINDDIGGWERGEDLIVFLARTGKGKTWVVLKALSAAWQKEERVGFISTEMSPNKVGFRFDTTNKGISNTALLRGYKLDDYKTYIEELSKCDIPLIVATPEDFKRKITVSKLRNFCKMHKLTILAIDGISYLRDERPEKGDQSYDALTHISADLLSLSLELKIPIIVVTQATRDTDEETGPIVKNIRGGDGIAHGASRVVTINRKDGKLDICFKKNRHCGGEGRIFSYIWDIDRGEFVYYDNKRAAVNTKKKVDAEEDSTSVF
jgi:replicative DNA helicase